MVKTIGVKVEGGLQKLGVQDLIEELRYAGSLGRSTEQSGLNRFYGHHDPVDIIYVPSGVGDKAKWAAHVAAKLNTDGIKAEVFQK